MVVPVCCPVLMVHTWQWCGMWHARTLCTSRALLTGKSEQTCCPAALHLLCALPFQVVLISMCICIQGKFNESRVEDHEVVTWLVT